MSKTFHCPRWPKCGCPEGGEKSDCPGKMLTRGVNLMILETVKNPGDLKSPLIIDTPPPPLEGCSPWQRLPIAVPAGKLVYVHVSPIEDPVWFCWSSHTAAPSSPATAETAGGVQSPAGVPASGLPLKGGASKSPAGVSSPPAGELSPRSVSQAIMDVVSERGRQVRREGWTFEHDDEHDDGSLALAAAAYAASACGHTEWAHDTFPASWDFSWFKPSSPRRDLVKAGALIIAEIERLDRKEAKSKS